MAPRRDQKKRMGKKHRQASTRPRKGKAPRTGAQMATVAPKKRKALSAKQAAQAKESRKPTQTPERERSVILPPHGTSDSARGERDRSPSKGHGSAVRPDQPRSETEWEPHAKRGGSVRTGDREVDALAAELDVATSSAGAESQPLVAICGRPNVGKSTLFNRITGTRRSIVCDEPGITRDRIYGEVEWNGRQVRLVDTGGVIPDDEALIPSDIFRQARVALDEADAIIMVIDGRTVITGADNEFSRLLMRGGKPLFLAVNKMDTEKLEAGAENFRTLGFRNVYPISAEHGSGIGDLLDAVWEVLPAAAEPVNATENQGHPAPEGEEPEEILDTQDGEMAEDEGDFLADRAALVPRAIFEDLLQGEAATADEPAGVDAPPLGQPDREPPTGGTGKEPKLTQAAEPSRSRAVILSAAKDLGISDAEIADLGIDEGLDEAEHQE